MGSVKSVTRTFTRRMDQPRWSWLILAVCLLVLGVVAGRPVFGHGFMTEPRPREEDNLKGDRRGWPIAGVPTRLTKPPCLDLPVNKQFTQVHPGPLRLKFFYGDGANHVGLCQVFLIDPKDPAHKIEIGEMMDCARSDHPGPGHKGEDLVGHMTVTIPATVPCDPIHCVLQWTWIATHRSVTRPEYYDNCADLTIVVGIASPRGPQRPEDQRQNVSRSAPPLAGPIAVASGEDAVRQLITFAMADGGNGNTDAIMAVKRRIESLPMNRQVEPSAHQQARAANERGLHVLGEGNMAEAVQAFQAAYQLAPTLERLGGVRVNVGHDMGRRFLERVPPSDVEIVNNFGYAYLRNHDPEAAEAWLLLALVLAPERVNAWVNLGQSYARQGELSMAIACLATGYRFSKNQAATRQFFLQKLAENENEDERVRHAARQTLQLPLLHAGKD